MPINILMPALSPTMTEGKLAKWLKNKGEQVKPGDVIAEIETDKATMEVEAVDEGTIADIRVTAGSENVPVNAVIAVMLAEGESETDLAKPDAVPAISPVPVGIDGARNGSGERLSKSVPSTPHPSNLSAGQPLPQRTVNTRIIASPLARRIARDQGLDLSQINGSGPGGRIVKADLGSVKAAPIQAAAPTLAKSSIEGRKLADLLGMKYRAEPNTTVRKTIARRLTEAKQTVPHFYLTIDCDIDFLMQMRARLNERGDMGKLSVNDFVIKASALALKQVPAANASWTDSEILYYETADISVAVATDNGLITPVIKAVETRSLADISKAMKDLGTRARAGKLKPEEYQGGSFTISNLGMFGIREFAAIINPPQACILAVGAGEQRAVVRNGQLAIATVMTCTLSVDHRAVDGAVGAEYLAAFKKLIEDPLGLVI